MEETTVATDPQEILEMSGRKFRVERNASGQPVFLHGKRALYTVQVLDPQYEPDTFVIFQSNGRQLRERQKDGTFVPVYLMLIDDVLQVIPARVAGG